MNGLRKPIVLAAGGTGGHVFPAQALAEELLGRGQRVVLVTDRRGDAFGDAATEIEVHRISAGRVDGGVVGKVRGVALLGVGLIQAGKLLRELSPAAVVGFGGYPSLPTMVAATRSGLATLIHEQNAVLGRVNRLVAARVSRIATSFAEVRGAEDSRRVVLTGNPVRSPIVAARDTSFPETGGTLRLLVMGGSQGARTLGRAVPQALALLPETLRRRLAVTQQCRDEDLAAARETYAAAGIDAETEAFFRDIPKRLTQTHLAISRAGASTVAELCCVGRPAILMPYPHATDDHQTANARAIEQAGGAWVVPDDGVTPESLAERLEILLTSPANLASAGDAARGLGVPDAASRLADAVEALAMPEQNGGSSGHARETAA